MENYKVIIKPVRGQEGNVYLYLYHNNNLLKYPKLVSLKIKLPEKYCNVKGMEVNYIKKGLPVEVLKKLDFKSVDDLNNYIKGKLEDFKNTNGSRNIVSSTSNSFNDFFESVIKRTINQGTIMRFRNVKNTIEKFQKYYSVNELKQYETSVIPFPLLTKDYLLQFRKYLTIQLTNNEETISQKLRCLRIIINKSIQEGVFNFPTHPFTGLKFKRNTKKVEILTMNEIKLLRNTDFVEVYRRTLLTKDGENLSGKSIPNGVDERNQRNKRYVSKHTLNDIRNYFLFQIFCQGIRVSDLVTLRYSHFIYENKVLKISKIMVKTNQPILIDVNENMTDILSLYISKYFNMNTLSFSSTRERVISLKKRINNYFFLLDPQEEEYVEIRNILDILRKTTLNHLVLFRSDYYIKVDLPLLDSLKEKFPQLYKKLKSKYDNKKENDLPVLIKQYKKEYKEQHRLMCIFIRDISKGKYKNEFVFDFLKSRDFETIHDNNYSSMNKYQYTKFQSVRGYYNKTLKLLGKQCGITKNITSHLARHTYTSLVVELGENINLFDVMTSLGHKHLSTTQTYLTRFTNTKIEQINHIITQKLNDDNIII